jgi:hypothetical protein
MISRFLLGAILGALIGAAVGAGTVFGLHLSFLEGGAVFAYLFAAATGVITGLVAGKPIWSSTGKIESGLKAVFGAVIAAGLMFAIRQWVTFNVDLSAANLGNALVGDLPMLSLPLVGAVLGGFFEADNSDADEEKPATKVRVKAGKPAATEDVDAEEEAEAKPAKKKAKR